MNRPSYAIHNRHRGTFFKEISSHSLACLLFPLSSAQGYTNTYRHWTLTSLFQLASVLICFPWAQIRAKERYILKVYCLDFRHANFRYVPGGLKSKCKQNRSTPVIQKFSVVDPRSIDRWMAWILASSFHIFSLTWPHSAPSFVQTHRLRDTSLVFIRYIMRCANKCCTVLMLCSLSLSLSVVHSTSNVCLCQWEARIYKIPKLLAVTYFGVV